MTIERDQASIIHSLMEHKSWLNSEVDSLRAVVRELMQDGPNPWPEGHPMHNVTERAMHAEDGWQ